MRAKSEIVVHKSSAKVMLWLSDEIVSQHTSRFDVMGYVHNDVWIKVMNDLRKVGLNMKQDKEIAKRYKSLSPSHKYGEYKGLECKSDIYTTGLKFEFYQNINTGDRAPGHGEYCFEKYDLMPYLIKKRFDYITLQIIASVKSILDCDVKYNDQPIYAEQAVVAQKRTSWHNKTEVTCVDDIQFQLSDYDKGNNSQDRDKKTIKCGEVKYFRDYATGRLFRGRVYHSLNNSWYVIVNKYFYRCVASWELFDPTPADFENRRVKKPVIPKERQEILDLLAKIPVGQLAKALWKRKRGLTLV